MKYPLLVKLLAIAALMLLLLIPLGMIGNSIDERRAYSEQVVRDIASSSSYNQSLVGPVLVVPYTKVERTMTINSKKESEVEVRTLAGKLHFLPELFRFDGDVTTELRKLGIYSARLYHANNRIDGHFIVPVNYGIVGDLADYSFTTPYVAVGISDIRGIKNSLKLQLNNHAYDFESGSKLKILGDGVHADFPLGELHAANKQAQQLNFSFDLLLDGTEQLQFSPIGKETHVTLRSDWPHPRFSGDFLPAERSMDELGFSARWQTSYFSTNMAEYFFTCVRSNQCEQYQQRQFGVSLIDPVNQYVKSDRAIKYALLFIALTFASFFLFEVLKRL